MDNSEFVGCVAKRIICSRNGMLWFGAGSDESQGQDFETREKNETVIIEN